MTGGVRVALTLEQCWHSIPGGTAVAGVGMARGLDNRNDVDPVGVAARHSRPAPAPYVPPIEVAHLGLPRTLLYESWLRFRRPSVERVTGNVDVVHATTLIAPPRSAPLVMTIHDLAFLDDPAHFTRRGASFFRRALKVALRDVDLVVCPSEATRRECLAVGFEDRKMKLIPLGIDPRRASPEDVERVRKNYGLTRPFVLWAGTIEPRKNLSATLRAFENLDTDAELILVGPRGWKQDVGELTSRNERVRVLGFVPDDDLRALHAAASVFCWPSLKEGFGFPVLEAMSQGTPVVTSKGTSTEEVAGGAALLVDPRDVDELRRALRRVLDDDGLARQLAESGQARAAEFTWERTADLLAEAYHDLTEQRRSGTLRRLS